MNATAVDDERGHEENRRESTSGSESTPSRRKSWNSSKSQPNTDAEHVLTVEPSIARPRRCTNGHSNNLVQELDDTHEDCNCGASTDFCTVHLSLWHNWNVQHSVEELELRHLTVDRQGLLGLLELVVHDHQDVSHHRRVAPYLYTALGWR